MLRTPSYANYARVEDFDALATAGIDVRGRVVLVRGRDGSAAAFPPARDADLPPLTPSLPLQCRYGRIFRGNKVENAESRGAIAVIIYSDPKDDGFVRGPAYPEVRHACSRWCRARSHPHRISGCTSPLATNVPVCL